jgi:hypothetical protein
MNSLNNRFSNTAMNYIEAWFDYHPEPFNIEPYEFLFDEYLITIFAAEMIHDNFMIKIECPTASSALEMENKFSRITKIMNITLIRINRNLFLFTDRRF